MDVACSGYLRAGVSERCAREWVARYREQGELGLHDRSSASRHVAIPTPQERVEVIIALRRLRFTAAEIAEVLQMALSTVSAILRRVGMGRLATSGSAPASSCTSTSKRLGRIEAGRRQARLR